MFYKACITSESPPIVALGFDSLAALCAEDVIGTSAFSFWNSFTAKVLTRLKVLFYFSDFYTAWKVISKSFDSLPESPIVAARYCKFLKFGFMDAAVHTEAAKRLFEILVGACLEKSSLSQLQEDSWQLTRLTAVESLLAYDVNSNQPLFINRLSWFLQGMRICYANCRLQNFQNYGHSHLDNWQRSYLPKEQA